MIGLIAIIIYAIATVIAVVGAVVYCKHLSNAQSRKRIISKSSLVAESEAQE